MRRDRAIARPWISRWIAWSAARARRWRLDTAWLPPAAFVWRAHARRAVRLAIQVLRVHGSPIALHLRPQWTVTSSNAAPVVDRVAPVALTLAPVTVHRALARADAARISGRFAGSPPATRAGAALRVRSLLERTVQEQRRTHDVEMRLHERARPATAAAAPATIARLLERRQRESGPEGVRLAPLVHKTPAQAPVAAVPHVAPAHDAAPAADRLSPPAPSSVAPPMSVEHLTEQVLRQIDRRVTAWRERMGKV